MFPFSIPPLLVSFFFCTHAQPYALHVSLVFHSAFCYPQYGLSDIGYPNNLSLTIKSLKVIFLLFSHGMVP